MLPLALTIVGWHSSASQERAAGSFNHRVSDRNLNRQVCSSRIDDKPPALPADDGRDVLVETRRGCECDVGERIVIRSSPR